MQWRLRTVAAAAMAAGAFGAMTAPAGAQLKQDPVMHSTTPVASNVHFGLTAAQVAAVEDSGEQLVDFAPDGFGPDGDRLFTVATVIPSGAAWKGFGFNSNPFPFDSSATWKNNGTPRVFDVELYRRPEADGGSSPRMGYLGVDNGGAFERAWRVVRRPTTDGLKKQVIARKERIVDLDRYYGRDNRHAAVVIRNTGSIARKWWFYVNVTTSFINEKLKAHKAAVTDIDPLKNGRYMVVMERSNLRPYYRVNRTPAQIVAFAQEKNDRVADIDPEPDAPGRYTAVFIPNG